MATALTLAQAGRNFAEWLRWIRVARGIDSQAELARRLGVSGPAVSLLLSAKAKGRERNPRLGTLIAAANLADFPIDYMLKNPPPPLPRAP